MRDSPPRVFISYAQESDEHSAWVLALAHKLAAWGIEPVIDRFCDWPERGWRTWMSERIEAADWVLVICTAEYLQRFEGKAPADTGRGVRWESQHITQKLYDHKFSNKHFVPVLPPGEGEASIPFPLRDYRKFCLDADFEDLYRLLTDQPATPAPVTGKLRRLPPLTVPALNEDAAPPAAGQPAARIPNPYPGLAAFTPEQHAFFFGREADTARVLARLEQTGFVSVVGGSGTGKSSLVAAGVVPALLATTPGADYLRFKPQADPLRQMAEAIDRKLPEEKLALGKPRAQRLRETLEANPSQLVGNELARLGQSLLLFCDQFEELFTQSPPERATSFRGLIDAIRQGKGLKLVLTLRSEFMPQLMEWLGSEAFEASLLVLDPIRDDGRLRKIIEGPADKAGVAVQPELLAALLSAAREMAGALPLLALTLEKLFAAGREQGGLTLDAYRAMGGLRRIVETAAAPIDQAIDADPALQAASDRLFAELATVIDELPTRRTALSAPLRTDPTAASLLDALRSQGFLTDPDPEHVELAHETLLLHWPRLQQWCERYGEKLAIRRQAEHAAAEWARASFNARPGSGPAPGHYLQWGWERQRAALQAMLALKQLDPEADGDFTDPGIHAWRALEPHLEERLKRFLQPEPLRMLDELARDDTPHTRREDIGRRLDQIRDPRRGVWVDADGIPDIEWIDIPAGSVTLETDVHETFAVAPFRIARYPVTWHQYLAFVQAKDGFNDPENWTGLGERPEAPGETLWGFMNHPAINVSWYDAMAFCRWLGRRLALGDGEQIRLPTEWEWQWVAQGGGAAREYPWGAEWNPARANANEAGIGRTTAVGMYPLGVPTPWPVLDLAGNVWEWCLNEYEQPDRTGLDGEASRVLRGGSWYNVPGDCRAAYRDLLPPGYRLNHIGFRVCRGSPIELLATAPLNTGPPQR